MAFGLTLVGLGAGAQDLAVSASFGQSFEAWADDGQDSPFRMSTDFGLDIVSETPLTKWHLSPGVRFGYLFEKVDPESLAPRLDSSFETRAGRYTFTASAQAVPRYVDETSLGNSNAADDQALQLETGVSAGLTYRATPLDSFSVGLNGRARNYLTDTQTLAPTRSLGLTGGWSRSVTPLTSLSLTPSLSYFESEASSTEASSRGWSAALRTGMNYSVSPTVTLNANIGPSVTVRSGGNENFGVVGGAGLSFGGPNRSFSISFSQEVDQNNDGAIENQTSLSLGSSYTVNQQSSFGLNASLGLQTPLDGGSEERRFFSISPSYSHQLTKDWRVSLGVRSSFEDDDGENSLTSMVFLRINRGFTLSK